MKLRLDVGSSSIVEVDGEWRWQVTFRHGRTGAWTEACGVAACPITAELALWAAMLDQPVAA